MKPGRQSGQSERLPIWRRPVVGYTVLGVLVLFLAWVSWSIVSTSHRRVPRYSLTCLTHCGQLGAALVIYIDEHEGRLPDADRWIEQLSPYLRGRDVLKCRSDKSGQASSYAMVPAYGGMLLTSIEEPGRTIIFYEADDGRPAFRHHDSMNVVYADGHAQTVRELPAGIP